MMSQKYKAVVIGASAGGLKALTRILSALPKDVTFAILIVLHRSPEADDYLEQSLNRKCALFVKQAEAKEMILPGTVYIAPPNYHLLVEDDLSFSLSIDGHVNYARPSIDVLFESAAEAFGQALAGLVLTGANNDGSRGLAEIQRRGGLAAVQTPETAEVTTMPLSAIAAVKKPVLLPLDEIAPFLITLGKMAVRIE